VEQGEVAEVFHHPKTPAARRLLTPKGAIKTKVPGPLYRLSFDGTTSDQPIISGMVLASGAAVNIWYADTNDIDGKANGQMLVELPQNPEQVAQMLAFLESQNVSVEREDPVYYD
jgi:D-methionine transport system ATP-binding protein